MAKDARDERVPNISQYRLNNLFIIYPSIFILRLIRRLTTISKSNQCFKWPHFTSNPTINLVLCFNKKSLIILN